jgi:hypothetical protein
MALRTGTTTSVVLALLYLSAYGAPPLFAALHVVRYRARARAQHAAFAAAAAGAGGGAAATGRVNLLAGVVRCDAKDRIAAHVTIRQDREEIRPSKGSPYWVWTEKQRTTRVVPFELLPEQGPPIHVEPGDSPVIVDELTTQVVMADKKRVREAKIRNGQRIFVEGTLRGGAQVSMAYRGGDERSTLEPEEGGSLLIATDAALQRFDARIRLLQHTALAGAAVWLSILAVAILPWLSVVCFGVHEAGVVDSVRAQSTKGGMAYHAIVVTPNGDTFDDYIDSKSYSALKDKPKQKVPTCRSFYPYATYLGPKPWIDPLNGIFLWMPLPFLVWFTWWAFRSKRPWYEGARLDEQCEG